MDFAQFLAYKDQWLQNINMKWLITGHLTEEDALKMVDITETSIDFNKIDAGEVTLSRCVKLHKGTIYNYENKNVLAKSSNSAVNCIFQIMFEDDRDKAAVAHILASLLHSPAYKQLRTVEQLGYIVKLEKSSEINVIHMSIKIQSNKYNSDYLEWRINEFLSSHEGGFTAESVESNKASIINEFKQEKTSLQEEAKLSWSQIVRNEFAFDRREQQIAAMEKVTVEQVNELLHEVIFRNPRRINLKIYSHAAAADTAKVQKAKDDNKAYYEGV